MKKKLLPVLTVFCLVILVLAAGVITFLIKKYTPSGEMMDGESFFQIQKKDEAALIVDRTVAEEKVKIIDGRYYASMTFSVHDGVCAVNVMVPKPVQIGRAHV